MLNGFPSSRASGLLDESRMGLLGTRGLRRQPREEPGSAPTAHEAAFSNVPKNIPEPLSANLVVWIWKPKMETDELHPILFSHLLSLLSSLVPDWGEEGKGMTKNEEKQNKESFPPPFFFPCVRGYDVFISIEI